MSKDKAQSMFAKLAEQQTKAAREETSVAVESQPGEPIPPPAPPVDAKPKRPAPTPKEEPSPKGKRFHPDYRQVNCYVRKSLHREVHRELLDMDGMDYSTLIESLLEKWLESKRKAK